MKLLLFKASWCPHCEYQLKEFNENPVDIKVKVVDIDKETDLTTTHNISAIPTMILLDDKNKELKKWTGRTESSVINEFIKKGKND